LVGGVLCASSVPTQRTKDIVQKNFFDMIETSGATPKRSKVVRLVSRGRLCQSDLGYFVKYCGCRASSV
jgi:hypothetical protein